MLIQRALFRQILPWLGEKKIIVIKGARQTGKTVLVGQIRDYLQEHKHRAVYFAVDQELNNPIFSDANLFIRYLSDQYGFRDKEKIFVLLDEFQYIKNAGLFLKNIFDKVSDKLQLVVSGSSSLEITKNTEYLTGRKIDFLLHHFSFKEFLAARSANKYETIFSIKQKAEIDSFYKIYKYDLEQNWLDFSNWGGYPEVVITGNNEKRLAILKDIVKTYIEKDIALFLRVENTGGFNNLIQVLASQVGNMVNRDEISATLGMGKNTVKKYMNMLAGTFVFNFIRPYSTNARKEISKMPKVYISDMGISRAVLSLADEADFNLISGAKVENTVFNELTKMGFADNIYYYRTLAKTEIDFIIKDELGLWPIEVKFRHGEQKLPLAVRNFKEKYKDKTRLPLIITQSDLRWEKDAVFLPVVLLPFINYDY